MAVRVAVEEQKSKIDKTTQDVEDIVDEMRIGETKTRDEIREIREEVNNIREMLPKVRSTGWSAFSMVSLVKHCYRWSTGIKNTKPNLSMSCNRK